MTTADVSESNTLPETASLLATLDRGGYPESHHWGWLVIADADHNLLYCTPDAPQKTCFWRSSAKPFQLLPLLRHAPCGTKNGLTPEEIAVACASHTASAYHLRIVQSLLQKAGLPAETLGCGPHAPIDAQSQKALICAGQPAEKIHNNCSGKHAAMLYHCMLRGWDTVGYLDPGHPLQQEILAVITEYSRYESIGIGTDGCGAPTFCMPMGNIARAFAGFGTTPEFEPVRRAIAQYPVLLGGEDRVDTAIITATGGRVLSKVGADGLICVTHTRQGLGLALKIADGNGDVRDKLVAALLVKLGWLTAEEIGHPLLKPFLNTDRINTQGKTVGRIRFGFLESGLLETFAPETVPR